MALIELKNINYCYSPGTAFEKHALRDVSMAVDAGESVGLIGHTGSGKSTLIRHFNGLLRPNSGQVLYQGNDLWKKPNEIRSIRFQIGLVFQYPETQIFEDTVGKDIAYGPRNMGLGQEEMNARIRESLQCVGLDNSYLERNPFRLSGGEMRRVAIAGVLAMRPKVLILDEPAAGLDPEGRHALFDALRHYRRKSGAAVVLVSHSMEDIADFVDRVVVLDQGSVALDGPVASVFAQAEKLVSIGLDIPQSTKVLLGLKAKGYSVKTEAYTVEQAEQELLRFLKEADRP